MKNILFFAVAFATISLVSSCQKNLVPWTNALSDKYDVEPEDVQFYISDNVLIKQDSTDFENETEGGKLKSVKKIKINEILFELGKKGVAVGGENYKNGDKRKILVSFEKDDDHYLSFLENPNYKNHFTIGYYSWNDSTGVGTLHYLEEEYFSSAKSACLLVDLKSVEKLDENSRKVSGRDFKTKK